MASRNSVIVLALMQERRLYDNYAQLLDSIRSVASVSFVETKKNFRRQLSITKPFAVVAVDSGISKHENIDILLRLIRFAKEGGIVVCCCNFSNHLDYNGVRQYFQSWGLPWDAGSYIRTTVHRNQHPDSVSGMSLDGLLESYSTKSLLLLHVPAHQAIYNPSSSSRIESRVFEPDLFPVDPAETPCAYAPIGRGYFGYIGDVNNEDGSTRVVIAMIHLPQDAVVPDILVRKYGLQPLPGGGYRKVAAGNDPNVLTVFSDVIRQAGGETQSGTRVGTVGETFSHPGAAINAASSPSSSNAPAASSSSDIPSQKPTTRNPPRPREAEVEARALKRTANSKRKMNEAESFKEQGNVLFRQGDNHGALEFYKKAVAIHGPRSIYQANIAAAYLKLDMWSEAEEACEEALKHDPKHLKARFRRGLARLAMHHFKDAMTDFKACATLAPQDPQFLAEMIRTRQEYVALKATDQCANSSDQDLPTEEEEKHGDCTLFDPAFDDPPAEISSDSDSSDFEHDGNGTPCRFYNHDGCKNGSTCKFKHSPTKQKTTRDELGRNVCTFWLLDQCKFGDKCHYAHSKEYLPDVGSGSGPWEMKLKALKEAMGKSTIAETSQKPFVMLLSLANQHFFAGLHAHLLSALRVVAEVSHVSTPDIALPHLSGSDLHAVFVTDPGIAEPQNANLLSALVEYAKSGGTVVFGALFSTFMSDMNGFFRDGLGVPWRQGSYHRTTFAVNSSFFDTDTFNTKQTLPQSYCIKAVHLKEIQPEDAVYSPTPESRIQSPVFPAHQVTKLDESPVVYTRFGKGYLGYNGDVSGEDDSTNIILAMLRLP